ncbi:hypothetical protein AB204_15180 [Xenorhabdus khoisanae]|uniref:Uncharacterized protein n=1 Tax=Xenorhabdus khoisanae TaxID=880157 RepID=A0A0J5FQA2_9GAMM|nr:hypothetical protein AB204_15180 [Xenorhabdus khoisanae]
MINSLLFIIGGIWLKSMWFAVTVIKQKRLKDMEKGVLGIPVITVIPAVEPSNHFWGTFKIEV